MAYGVREVLKFFEDNPNTWFSTSELREVMGKDSNISRKLYRLRPWLSCKIRGEGSKIVKVFRIDPCGL